MSLISLDDVLPELEEEPDDDDEDEELHSGTRSGEPARQAYHLLTSSSSSWLLQHLSWL